MRNAIIISAVLTLLLSASVVGQDEAPTVTVVPDSQFCTLVTPDDTTACEEVLATMAGAGLLPESFSGLMTSVTPAEVDETAAAAGKPVKIGGKGSKNTKPFMLAEGDYTVTLNKAKGCDQFTYAVLTHTNGETAGQGLVDQNGYMYAIEEGRYFWDAEADEKCKWAYVLTPLE